MDELLTRSIPQAAKMLGVSKNFAYLMAKSGQLKTIRLGRRRIVPLRVIEEILQRAK